MLVEKAFYFLAFLSILSALMVVYVKNPIHSVLYLVITFFTISCHYVLLNAQFVAVVNIIVYAGAIMVLFLFVIMFLNLNTETEPVKSIAMKFIGTIAGGVLFLVMVASVKGAEVEIAANPNQEIGLISSIGQVLFKDFLLPFEIASILLLAAMVGAVMLGKKEKEGVSEK